MATTKVTTGGITDATIATADIADNAITAAKLASGVQTTINNNADNRVITGSGTTNTLEAESELTYSSPQLKLLSTSAAPQIRINSDASDGSSTRLTIGRATGNNNFVNGATAGDSAITFPSNLLFGVQTAEKMRIDSSGKVGIGESSPITSLHVKHATDNGVAIFESGDASGGIALKDNSTTNNVFLFAETDDFKLLTGGSERMRIDTGGRILSGISSSNADDANAIFAGGGQAGTGNYGKIYLSANYTNPGPNTALSFIGNSTNNVSNNAMAFMGVYSDGQHAANNYPTRYGFWTTNAGSNSATEKLRIHSGGTVNIPGGLTLGESITSTASSNTLDDYEEGTWTPTFLGQLNGQSYTQQVGEYTKIGNVVVANCYLKLAGDPGSYASGVHIGGLPFVGMNVSGTSAAGCGVLAYQTNFISATDGRGNFTAMVNPNQSTLRLYTPDGTYFLWSEVNDRTQQVRFTITYRTHQ